MPMRVGGADSLISYRSTNAPVSRLFKLQLASKDPLRIGAKIDISFSETDLLRAGKVGLQSGHFFCGGKLWVVIETEDGEAVAIQPDSLERLQIMPFLDRPVWGYRRSIMRTANDELYITHIPLEGGSRRVRCVDNHVSSVAVMNVENNFPAYILAIGAGRSDGKRRFYAVTGTPRTLAEGTVDASGKFRPETRILLDGIGDISQIAVGDARNDGRNRVYVSGSRGLVELTWDGTSYRSERIDGEEREGAFTEFTAGLIVDSFRDDAKNRIYLANGNVLSEYSFTKKKWARIEFRPLDQRIYAMAAMSWIRPSRRLVLLGEQAGAYGMKWLDEGWTVVAPFVGPRGAAPEGEAAAELVRQHLIGLGNCRVLEREKMSAILAERDIQVSRLMDPKATHEMGKLLGADQVIVGRIESILGSKVVSVKSVKVEDGSISRQQFIEARSVPELKARIPDLSFGICTGKSQ